MSVKSEKSLISILDKANNCALLHRGGEADVYELECGESRYALKWYHEGFRYDVSVVERLKHLNISGLYRVRESGVRENTPYLVYDFLEGVCSADVSAMPVAVALQLLRDLVQTLVLLDKEGIHHGDINPANVILCNSGTHLQAVLIDCGIVGPGALGYAAPERFQGQPASAKSDLYSLGMLLFRWVAGQNLLDSQDYNEFASQAFAIDTMDVSSRLYEIDCCSAEELSALPASDEGYLKIVTTGILADMPRFLELIDKNNMVIADDQIAQESVGARTQTPVTEDPILGMAQRLSDIEGCSVLYDLGKFRGKQLVSLAQEAGAAGILFVLTKFCDPEEYDYVPVKRMTDAAGIPMLQVEIDQQMKNFAQAESALQAFAEMLRER